MSGSLRMLTVVGARPQFIKAAAVSRAARRRAGTSARPIDEILVHTGQHYDERMSDAFFAELGLAAPDHNLDVGSGGHGEQTGEMMRLLEPIAIATVPDVVTVYGDTNSTLAGGLVASKLQVPVAHVEAGLRSFDRTMPEEINRVLVDHVSSLLLCPSDNAVANLAAEGIVEGVSNVGDVMYDVLKWQLERLRPGALSAELSLSGAGYVFVTVHRAGNTDDPERLARIAEALSAIARTGMEVVFPVHPRTAKLLGGRELRGVHQIPPVSHAECLALVADADVVVTDSGGLQKEAYWMQTPCVTLRDQTEWPETVSAGWNQLVGLEAEAVVKAVLSAAPPIEHPSLYGDGAAADRILDLIEAIV